ncbi:MAG: hypothetical protein ACLP01_16675 [Solirubrobacteraceae bacterium]
MRDLWKITAARLRIAASTNGWARDPVPDIAEDGSPRIRWRRTDGVVFLSGDPEIMPTGVKQAVRALLCGFFAHACPCCDAKARWLSEDEMVKADAGRVQAVTMHGVVPDVAVGWSTGVVFAIEHAADCPVRPESVSRMVGAGRN